MNCAECGRIPYKPTEVPDGSYAICYSCLADHCHVGPHRDGSTRLPLDINGEPYSPDGVIWYAPDRMRHADGRALAFVETYEEWCGREQLPEITVQIRDPLGFLGADHPKAITIGGTSHLLN